MKNRVAVMHGVNLDMLERRPSDVYGELSFPQLERQIGKFAQELGLETRFFQSNFEGEFVEELHRAADYADGLLLNPAPGRTTRGRCATRSRSPGCRPSRSTSPTSRRASSGGISRCSRASSSRR